MKYDKDWDYLQIEKFDDLSDIMCNCDGSGEGYTSDSRCNSCNGRGTLYSDNEITEIINEVG